MSEQTTSGAEGSNTAPAGQAGGAQQQAGQQAGQQPIQGTRDADKVRAFNAAVSKTVQVKAREAELAKQMEQLKPIQDIQALVAQGNVAEAFKRLAGQDKLLDVYQQLTPDILGMQNEEKALEALPKSVRERLAKVEELEARVAGVADLEAKLADFQKRQDETRAVIEARQRESAAQTIYTAGFESLKVSPGEDAEFIRTLPNGQEMLQARWVEMLEEKQGDLAKLKPEERQRAAVGYVMDAARALREETFARFGPLLRPLGGKGKMRGNQVGQITDSTRAPETSPAASTSGPKVIPRTVTPGGLGEPRGVDLSKLNVDQRIAFLKREERAGRLKTGG